MTSKQTKTFLGMPGYGQQTAAAGRGLWRASRDMDSVAVEYRQGSLLASNFNGLWCRALTACHRGEPVEYFAMLHADIGPEDFWLDTLIEEMDEKNLDVLGVAVPIKDGKGLTSLAIDGEDTFRPKCRLTMAEIYSLPDTFTSEDVGGSLLINTGCWVCRFDPEWTRKIHFEINDRIVFNKGLDMYQAEVEPEDWYFSRLCHELGLRVGATSKVAIEHRGDSDFTNKKIWGGLFDAEYLDRSSLPYVFPFDVSGWLRPEEGRILNELGRGKRVLEIGSYCGRSTICLASEAESLVSVDPHDGTGTPEPRNTEVEFTHNIKTHGLTHVVTSYKDIADVEGEFDLIFIDGAHDYENVSRDIRDALDRIAPGGLIAFHDYRKEPGDYDGGWDPDVTRAVNEFVSDGAEILQTVATVAVCRPPVREPVET